MFPALLEALSEAVYATDAKGRITFFNGTAAQMWGVAPDLGTREFQGVWKVFWPDGLPFSEDETPTALALKKNCAIRGLEAIGERSDGRRIAFSVFASPLMENGAAVGAVILMLDMTDRTLVEQAKERLAAIVESSDDAIIAKDINGVITDWNRGAERLFGYSADEAIGRSITMLIPEDRHDEEPAILARLRRGERIDHYETIRRHKDGSLIEISLSVSPVRNRAGRITGASKIARDITVKRRAEQQQRLLLAEMSHRIKNLFSLAGSIVTLSARSAASASQLASAVSERLRALAKAHELTIPTDAFRATGARATLQSLIETVMAPYQDLCAPRPRIRVKCCDTPISGEAVTSFALLINELATNAAKYGSLSAPDGRVEINCGEHDGRFVIDWQEIGGPKVSIPSGAEGFGSRLVNATVEGRLNGSIRREWKPEGLAIHVSIDADRIAPMEMA
ncbi:PAS domain S-box protein [Rhodoblastus sp.]|jgi:PAS domain S-box-containing protein|uniref:PAS domain S-box protein n=1 Tax=Rhodoblastus sp. TaxID=1962975 RepID=UPI0025DD5F95|nr:PAS domain S-box protein [Rhodoblastus sp.]